MPIVNYAQKAKTAQRTFFENPAVSDVNKAAIRSYLDQYTVKPATLLKFFAHIVFLLKVLPDIRTQMHDRELINKTFKEFRDSISPGYYATIVNVSRAFTRWLNEGQLPKGFLDVRQISRSEQLDQTIKPKDMWTWADVEKFCSMPSASIQFQAIISTQADCGFRPSEFVDLNYGDVTVDKDVLIFQVHKGKTGSRVVPSIRCTPHFMRWYEMHPTKKDDDPMWITEFMDKSHPVKGKKKEFTIRRYEYAAILKRVRTISEKAGIKKPCDFYNIRHSSCVLDKMENVPVEIAAKRHGHSVEYFTRVYGRLDPKDEGDRLRSYYRSNKEVTTALGEICPKCNFVNEKSRDVCHKCASPLTVTKAMQLYSEREEREKQLLSRLEKLEQDVFAADALTEAQNKAFERVQKDLPKGKRMADYLTEGELDKANESLRKSIEREYAKETELKKLKSMLEKMVQVAQKQRKDIDNLKEKI